MERCIVNYITLSGWRPRGQERLGKSLDDFGYDGRFEPFNEKTVDWTPHNVTPYAFKMHALKYAQTSGADIGLWLDASFWAVKPLEPLFDSIVEHGVLVQANEHLLGQWCSDECLRLMMLQRKVAWKMPMFSGGLIGIDFRNKRAVDWFDKLFAQAEDGRAFRGPWRNRNREASKDADVLGHRHDMSVGSILLDRCGLKMQYNNTLFSYYAWYERYKDEREIPAYFLIEGGERPRTGRIPK